MEQLAAGQIQVAAPIEWIAFKLFTPFTIGLLSMLLGLCYLCDSFREKKQVPRPTSANITRALSWILLAVSFFHNDSVATITWRAMLRMSVGFIIVIDLAYKIYDLQYLSRQAKIWTLDLWKKAGCPM